MTALVDQSSGSELALLADARSALERARTLDEVKSILDVAVAAKRYAEAKKLGEDSVRYAQEIVNRATRRMGEMLRETPKNPGAAIDKLDARSNGATTPPKLSDLGISKDTSSKAQKLAAIPDEVFEKAADKPQKRLLRVAREAAAEQRRSEPIDPQTVHGAVDIRHGDFRKVLDDIEPGTVDAIITDPPYPGEFVGLFDDLSALAARVLKHSGVLAVMCGQYYLPEYIAMLSTAMRYRWCGAYIAQGPRTRVHAAKVGTGWKPILIFQRHGVTKDDLAFILDDLFDSAGDDKRHHHWGQSESGTGELVERLTTSGALVVDPFLGGGTTAVVCRDLGRRFIGCDIDAAHVSTSRERVA